MPDTDHRRLPERPAAAGRRQWKSSTPPHEWRAEMIFEDCAKKEMSW
jgi:hypothetical protein